jgi:hypothetical protein
MPAHAAGRAEATKLVKLVKLVKEHCWISTFGGSGGMKLGLAKERRGGSVEASPGGDGFWSYLGFASLVWRGVR